MKRIKELCASDGYKLKVTFEGGGTKTCDISPFLEKGVFKKLKDHNAFKRVKNMGYFVEWPYEIDLSADTLYKIGVKSQLDNLLNDR